MSDVLDWDRWEAELGPDTAPQITLGPDGRPLDPAQTRAYDDQQQLRIQRGHLHALDADRQARAERRAERQELEQHWDRETHAHALVAQQRAQPLPVQYHVHYMVEVPAQPTYAPPPAYQSTWTAAKARNENIILAIAIATCSLLALAAMWLIAGASYYHGQAEATETQFYSTSTTTYGAKP